MRLRSWPWLILIVCLALVTTTSEGRAQQVILDSVNGLLAGSSDEFECGQKVELIFRLTNFGDDNVLGSTNGFRLYSPDGATWSPGVFVDTSISSIPPPPTTTFDTTLYGTFIDPPEYADQSLVWKGDDPQIYDGGIFVNFYSDSDGDTGTPQEFGTGSDTVGFAGFAQETGTGIFSTFDGLGWKIVVASFDCSSHNKTICLDSAFFRPTGEWLWSTPAGDVRPTWDGPHCYTVIDPDAPAAIGVDPDSLHFDGVVGGTDPFSQAFTVSSDQPVGFSLSESIPWISVSPTSGTTDQNITVSADISGLGEGDYKDSIRVDAPGVPNSPQFVVVTLSLVPPPPEIGVDPTEFFFNAVAGEPNPPAKTLTITNVGGPGSQLNWTLFKSEPWLTLSPTSGTDSGDVSVAVDITGLPFGEYDDTILVVDSNAVNDSVKIPVHLSIGSDLPVIDVDSSFNTIIVDLPTSTVDPRWIYIRNDGQGTMSYRLEFNSPRISSATPDSGLANDSVRISFKVIGPWAVDGANLLDTVWVYSDEAINSPYPVVFWFAYRTEPRALFANNVNMSIDYFECTQGVNTPLPSNSFTVQNLGGDDPMKFKVDYESDLFTTNIDSGVAPQTVVVQTKELDLPLGTYHDSIMVSATAAINSPLFIHVEVNVIPGEQTPAIWVNDDSLVAALQENRGPALPYVVPLEINNVYGGCMEWEIVENIPYMVPTFDSGNVPSTPEMQFNTAGFTLGDYVQEFHIVAPSARNDPKRIVANLQVWRFRGDLDWSGRISIADLTYFVNYLFVDGPPPQPEIFVADLDCTARVNIADLTYQVNYMFKDGPKPCTNP